VRVEPSDLAVEQPGFVPLVDDDPVAVAPPDLQRDAGEGDPLRPVELAADVVDVRVLPGRAAELEHHLRLHRRVEGGCAGE
jgi:hypothetical protein